MGVQFLLDFCSMLVSYRPLASTTSSDLLHSLGSSRSSPERNTTGGARHPASQNLLSICWLSDLRSYTTCTQIR